MPIAWTEAERLDTIAAIAQTVLLKIQRHGPQPRLTFEGLETILYLSTASPTFLTINSEKIQDLTKHLGTP